MNLPIWSAEHFYQRCEEAELHQDLTYSKVDISPPTPIDHSSNLRFGGIPAHYINNAGGPPVGFSHGRGHCILQPERAWQITVGSLEAHVSVATASPSALREISDVLLFVRRHGRTGGTSYGLTEVSSIPCKIFRRTNAKLFSEQTKMMDRPPQEGY